MMDTEELTATFPSVLGLCRPRRPEWQLQRRQNFLDVLLRFHFEPDFFDFAVRANEKGDAMGAHIFAAHEALLAPNAVGLHDLAVFVGEQDEWEFEFRHE